MTPCPGKGNGLVYDKTHTFMSSLTVAFDYFIPNVSLPHGLVATRTLLTELDNPKNPTGGMYICRTSFGMIAPF